MLQSKCLFGLFLLTVASGASVKQDIPVRVVYDSSGEHIQRNFASVRNLNEKSDVPSTDLILPGNSNAIKNLDEKVQLSQEELSQATRYLPVPESQKDSIKSKSISPTNVSSDTVDGQEKVNNCPTYQKLQEIINNGIENIKENVNSSGIGESIGSETWDKLHNNLGKLLENFNEKIPLRQSPNENENALTNLISQFQTFANNFVPTLTNNRNQSDEGQPGFGETVTQIFTNGFQSITSGISSLINSQNSTNLSPNDPSSGTTPTSGFQNFVNQVQGVLSGQTDPLQAINNLNPLNQGVTQKPASQEEESTQGGPGLFVNNVIQQVGQVFNNLNPLNQVTQKPVGQEDSSTTSGGPLQFVNQLGQTFGSIFRPQSGSGGSQSAGDSSTTKNPIQTAVEGVSGQVSQGISNLTSSFQSPNNTLSGLIEQVGTALNSTIPTSTP